MESSFIIFPPDPWPCRSTPVSQLESKISTILHCLLSLFNLYTFAGETAYIACPIAPHFLSGVPGVLVPSSGVATFTFSGREWSTSEYEVLTCSEPEVLYWKEHCCEVPKNAVHSRRGMSIGRTCTPLEAGVPVSGPHGLKTLQPLPGFQGPLVGKIIQSHHLYPGLRVAYNRYEFVFSTFSTLCAYQVPPLSHSEASTVSWEKTSGNNLPPNAFQASSTPSGEAIYIGRALHRHKQLVPGHVVPSLGRLSLCWGSREHQYDEYEALVVNDAAAFHWVYACQGDVPAHAVAGGEQDRETVYIGRTVTGCDVSVGKTWKEVPIQIPSHSVTNTQLVGKVHPSHQALYVPHNGQEYIYRDSEFLTSKPSPKKLAELCRNEILIITKGIPGRVDLLPLPLHLKTFCKLREEDWN